MRGHRSQWYHIKKKIYYIKEKKKSWEPFEICLLNSTANPAQFWWKLAEFAVLFSRQILNGSQDFSFFYILCTIFSYFFNETIKTNGRAILSLIILGIGSVISVRSSMKI